MNSKQHCFIPVALFFFILNVLFIFIPIYKNPLFLEIGTLFNLSFMLPMLYLFCYRTKLRRALTRAAAFSFLGVWVASILIDDKQQVLLLQIMPLRYIGMAVLFLIEIRLLITVLHFIMSSDESNVLSAELLEKGDIPQWYATLMTYEAVFWRRLYQWIKRIINR